MVLGGTEMGMDLSTSYLLLDSEQYQKLKNKELYIKSNYELKLVSAIEAEEYKKSIMFDAMNYYLDDLLENNTQVSINFTKEKKENSFNLEDFIKENIQLEEELPITLDEFLNYDYCGEWVINELHEDFVNDKDCYLIIQLRYW